ncbi:hypothetical protein ACHAXA_004795 [Cyclostephanos tholiformis]|uniref:Uncharacterized protein n=1 Tax=Cyclostephanos tholiformis TaxID=382380 RepID=A0ABD3RA90_9STRA
MIRRRRSGLSSSTSLAGLVVVVAVVLTMTTVETTSVVDAFSFIHPLLPMMTSSSSLLSSSSRGYRVQTSTLTSLGMAQRMTPTRKTRKEDSFDRDPDGGNPDDDEVEEEAAVMLDFSEAQAKIKEDENRRRIEEGLTTGLTKEVSETTWDEEEFNAKRDQYEEMRAKVRARASQEGFEKSVATKKAIEEATARAMSGTSSATSDQMLDLSGFGEKFVDDGTDELTPEEKAEIDAIANMPLWDQIGEELSNTRFPTPMAVFQTACVMALIFAVSATLILRGDAAIRDLYTGFGFIPRPDEVYDFGDLALPDGFLEQRDLESDIGDALRTATDIADQILPSSSSSNLL